MRIASLFRRKSSANSRADYTRSESRRDVCKEKNETDLVIRENRMHEYAMIVSGLEKQYANQFYAVRGLDFSVRKGICFGLLGMNGAGKTTTFRIMTRLLAMTEGEIFFNGEKCGSGRTSVRCVVQRVLSSIFVCLYMFICLCHRRNQ